VPKRQFSIFAILLATYALVAFISYLFFYGQMTQSLPTPAPAFTVPVGMALGIY
jgi:uncharacterized membrane protein (DUF485 family)